MSPSFVPNQKKVIFFDMNNTLVDRRKCFDSAFVSVLKDFTGRWSSEDTELNPQQALQNYKIEWSRHRKTTGKDFEAGDELRYNCLLKALEPYHFKVTPGFSKIFFKQIDDAEESFISLFPGVEETLRALSAKYTLAIISNGSRKRLEQNLNKLQLTRWIRDDWIFTSQQDGPRKPHPGLFETAMATTGTSPAQGLMIGNSWKNDIIGATRCGLDAIWIHPNHVKKISQRKIGKQKVVIIRSFRHLIHVLL
ncbi:HAD family hydrolase [Paenibacillus albiflavus]|uniref:HAD family hydrolase n=1 Tax=Paenibacillus albiflavus TaxID=2545760 RepID=A0A4R4E8V2_9BACL|nr:HAD family hydrolase [Paenibacillus albiflavus]TCZ75290.1 HAD family hydrolase [Paenibacillus albiflavus]